MSRAFDKYFSSNDVQEIENSVKNAEKITSGEIVPYVVDASDEYAEALWRAGAAFAAMSLIILTLVHSTSQSWQPFELLEAGFVLLGASLAGVLLARFVEPVKRYFAGHALLERRVGQRAAEAFLSEEVFATRDRTGILIFLSLLEHKVVILGDSGINAKVQQAEWDDVAHTIVEGMKSRAAAPALIKAIGQCGTLLNKEGVAIRYDDSNELPNTLRRRKS